MDLSYLKLKAKADRRLKAGHLWIFSNEVDTKTTPLTEFEPGQVVLVVNNQGKVLGSAYVNPASLICARLVSRDAEYILNKSLIVHYLNIALSLRQRLFDKPYYRLVHSEGDFLPGLVVDRFGDVLVVQLNTAGMERVKADVISALEQVLRPSCIIFRNDSSIRSLEGLPLYTEVALGEAPDSLQLEENDTRFEVLWQQGQKTGWFYDHRLNRARMAAYVKDNHVLDVFSYMGGWGLQAAKKGAAHVTCIDASAHAVQQVLHNAALNDVGDKVTAVKGDAFEQLKILRQEGRRFQVVVLDPPAFIKRKKDLKEGENAYRRLNQLAISLVEKGGILISASCSYHLPKERLLQLVQAAARHGDRACQLLEQGHQGPDHPIHPAILETEYLKAFICRLP